MRTFLKLSRIKYIVNNLKLNKMKYNIGDKVKFRPYYTTNIAYVRVIKDIGYDYYVVFVNGDLHFITDNHIINKQNNFC